MPTKGANTAELSAAEHAARRKTAKQSRQPKKGGAHRSQRSSDEANVYLEGRERQVAAIRKELAEMKAEGRRREFLDVMLSVYGGLEKSDRKVEGKFLTPVQATFRKIEAVVGLDALKSAWEEWKDAKSDFYEAEHNHPLRKYCATVEAEIAERTRLNEEHLSQSLGALINRELISA